MELACILIILLGVNILHARFILLKLFIFKGIVCLSADPPPGGLAGNSTVCRTDRHEVIIMLVSNDQL